MVVNIFFRRLSDVLKRKKPPKRPARKSNKNDESPEVDKKALGVGRSSRSKGSSKEKSGSSSSSKMSFLPSLNPRSWGKLSSSSSSSSSDRPLLSKACKFIDDQCFSWFNLIVYKPVVAEEVALILRPKICSHHLSLGDRIRQINRLK
jgi:hypothetical protein